MLNFNENNNLKNILKLTIKDKNDTSIRSMCERVVGVDENARVNWAGLIAVGLIVPILLMFFIKPYFTFSEYWQSTASIISIAVYHLLFRKN
jgi:hypothetical protein